MPPAAARAAQAALALAHCRERVRWRGGVRGRGSMRRLGLRRKATTVLPFLPLCRHCRGWSASLDPLRQG
eukprot:15155420-Alexandrium_andersonii.AAC.1